MSSMVSFGEAVQRMILVFLTMGLMIILDSYDDHQLEEPAYKKILEAVFSIAILFLIWYKF